MDAWTNRNATSASYVNSIAELMHDKNTFLATVNAEILLQKNSTHHANMQDAYQHCTDNKHPVNTEEK